MTGRRIVLASTSRYRAALMERLRLPFETVAPVCDETARPGESATALVERLARAKAAGVAQRLDDALVIGADQVAVLDDATVGKPGDHESARAQLRACSGRTVLFRTGLAVIDAASDRVRTARVDYAVEFRHLADDEIERYLAAEAPYDCAGSIRSEGYAVALFARLRGDDPTALVGLPLIRLRALLAELGLPLP